MILTDSMLDAAYKFRMAEPWKELTDSDIFAAKLSDGTVVYCSIMGNAGEHHSLGIYIGNEGFSTFLKTLLASNMNVIESMSASIEFDCINCDFMQAKDIDDEVKKKIRDYAERNAIKIPRKSGWIDFTRFSPFKGQWCITDGHDALVAEEALEVATFFANEFKGKSYSDMNLDPIGRYPTAEGGKVIPFITIGNDGRYHISTTNTPPLIGRQYIAPTFDNDILASKMKSMKKADDIECRLLHMPMPVSDDDGETVPAMMGAFILADVNTGEMLMPLTTTDYPDSPQSLLTKLATYFCDNGISPKRMTVSDDKTYMLIKDFCRRCGIQLLKVKDLPDMDEMCVTMIHGMMMQGMLMGGMSF